MTRSQRRVAALIGSPIGHSLSPVIHQAAFDAAGVPWSYVAFEVAAGDGTAAIAAMRTLGIGGLSVTMPHKEEVAVAVDRLDPAAVRLAAVNTVSWDGDELVGSSTDGEGFVASLDEAGCSVADASVVVLGAGGAARSVIDALGRAGVAGIAVVNRTAAKAEEAAALATVAAAAPIDAIADADIVVNATNVGMGDDASLPCPAELLSEHHVVADLVYHPLRTPLLKAAEAAGATTVDGLGMLIHQAALQQFAWLGELPDISVMRAAAESALEC